MFKRKQTNILPETIAVSGNHSFLPYNHLDHPPPVVVRTHLNELGVEAKDRIARMAAILLSNQQIPPTQALVGAAVQAAFEICMEVDRYTYTIDKDTKRIVSYDKREDKTRTDSDS